MIDAHSDGLEADAYQAGHHGSTTSSTTPFMNHVTPDVAIISSAYDSQYGHPHDEVLKDFADRGIETYWTAVHGDIVLTTNGNDVASSQNTSSRLMRRISSRRNQLMTIHKRRSPTRLTWLQHH